MLNLADIEVPHDYEYEKAVLGYLMTPQVHDRFVGIVKPEHFWSDRHRDIFNVIVAVSQSGGFINSNAVYNGLKARNLHEIHGGITYLRDCSSAVLTTAGDVEWYARELRRIHVQRQVMEAGSRLVQLAVKAGETPEEALLGEALEVVMAIDDAGTRKGARTLAEVIDNGVREQVGAVTGLYSSDARYIPTGLTNLDFLIRGFRKSGLYLVSAPTSLGKSLWVQDRGLHLAEQGHRVLLFTTEMADEDVVSRQVFMAAELDEHVVRRNGDSSGDGIYLDATMTRIHDLPIVYVDDSNMAIERLEVEVRQQSRSFNPCLIIVDHFHELSTERRFNREDLALEYIADRLKKIARRYDVPVVAVAQQNRGDHTGNMNAALKGTSALEQKADTVVFLRGSSDDGETLLDPDEARERAGNPGWMRVKAAASKVRTGGMTGTAELCVDWSVGGKFFDWGEWESNNYHRVEANRRGE